MSRDLQKWAGTFGTERRSRLGLEDQLLPLVLNGRAKVNRYQHGIMLHRHPESQDRTHHVLPSKQLAIFRLHQDGMAEHHVPCAHINSNTTRNRRPSWSTSTIICSQRPSLM